jgi:hypothetical protein
MTHLYIIGKILQEIDRVWLKNENCYFDNLFNMSWAVYLFIFE